MLKDAASLPLPDEQAALTSFPDSQNDWLAGRDGTQLFYRRWTVGPDAPIVVYFHGIEGHSLWFAPTAGRLLERGINAYAADRRGAGMNSQDRGHLSDYRIFLQDISDFLYFVKERHPRSPVFVLGNCWGAKATILVAAQQSAPLDGLILTSPALKTRVDVGFLAKLRIAGALLTGSRETFELPLVPRMFTGNPSFVRFITEDELRMTHATAQFLVETLKLRWLARRAAERINVPILLLQSGRDAIADTAGGDAWFSRVASTDKTTKFYPDSEHTIDFDESAVDYIDTLADWVWKRTPGRTA